MQLWKRMPSVLTFSCPLLHTANNTPELLCLTDFPVKLPNESRENSFSDRQ